jgi:hypothetical protein
VAAEAQAAVDADQAALTYSQLQDAPYSQLERTTALASVGLLPPAWPGWSG